MSTLYINSYYGNGTSTNFTISKVGEPVFNISPTKVKVLSVNIPNSWYGINTNNNVFQFTDVSGVHTITITPGNYTNTSLESYLSTAMTTASPPNTYTVTITNNIMTISSTVTFSLNFAVASSSYKVFGFEFQSYPTGMTITALRVVKLNYSDIFVTSNLVNGYDNGVIPYYDQTNPDMGILIAVPVANSTPGTNVQYINPWQADYINMEQSSFASGSQIMSFTLSTDDGILSLNGQDWSMVMAVN